MNHRFCRGGTVVALRMRARIATAVLRILSFGNFDSWPYWNRLKKGMQGDVEKDIQDLKEGLCRTKLKFQSREIIRPATTEARTLQRSRNYICRIIKILWQSLYQNSFSKGCARMTEWVAKKTEIWEPRT